MPIRTESEKLDYYRYGGSPSEWSFREPDVLSPDVIELMRRERVDHDYRFLWMGAAVVRVHGNEIDRNPVVRGDPRACVYQPKELILNGILAKGLWLQPKDLFVQVLKVGYWYWTDGEGVRHKADREDQLVAPAGTLVRRQDLLWDLGHLVWTLQIRITGERGVEDRLYSPADAPLEYWQTLKTFRNPAGGYLAPTVLDVDNMILKREHQNRALSQGQMRELITRENAEIGQRKQEAQARAEANQKAEFNALTEEIIADNSRAAHSTSGRPAQLRR